MQFTPQELKLIERLRKQERRWPRTRWILLGMAAFLLAAYGYIAYRLFGTLGSETFSPADSALLFALFWPKVLLMAVMAGAFIALAVRDWHGNVHRMLLLRLLDTHQKEKDEHVS
jgi:hypothetical protein